MSGNECAVGENPANLVTGSPERAWHQLAIANLAIRGGRYAEAIDAAADVMVAAFAASEKPDGEWRRVVMAAWWAVARAGFMVGSVTREPAVVAHAGVAVLHLLEHLARRPEPNPFIARWREGAEKMADRLAELAAAIEAEEEAAEARARWGEPRLPLGLEGEL